MRDLDEGGDTGPAPPYIAVMDILPPVLEQWFAARDWTPRVHQRAMLAAALPAPTTTVRPTGGVGRRGGTHLSGAAAATAASNRARKTVSGIGSSS